MASVDCIYKIILDFGRNLHLRSLYILGEELDVLGCLNAFELITDFVLPVCYQVIQCFDVLLRQGQNNLSLEWDGIAHVAALP